MSENTPVHSHDFRPITTDLSPCIPQESLSSNCTQLVARPISRTVASVCLSLVALLCMTDAARSQRILIDDFDDGDDVGWVHFDALSSDPDIFGPGTFDASTGSYQLTGAEISSGADLDLIFAAWEPSLDNSYSDGFVRTKLRAENSSSVATIALRVVEEEETYYSFGINPTDNDLFIYRSDGFDADGELLAVMVPTPPVVAGQDWIVEAGAVGDKLSLRFWLDGTPEPATPQMSVIDPMYSTGGFGLAVNHGPFLPPAVPSATFDDVYFTVPEPTTLVLAVMALGVLFARNRRCSCRSAPVMVRF